jgi:hypothetical protein
MRPTLTLLLVLLALPACDDDVRPATGAPPEAAADSGPDTPTPPVAVDAAAGDVAGDINVEATTDVAEGLDVAPVETIPEASADGPPVLTAVVVTPAGPSLIPNRTSQMQATAVYHDLTLREVTSQATWTSSHPQVATVNNAGLVSTLTSGETTITAEYQGVSGSTRFVVTTVGIRGVGVLPATASLARGTSRQMTAHLLFADDTSQEVTEMTQWSVEHPAIATVSNQDGQRGLVQALAEGQTTVRAMFAGGTGTATLTVTAP